jgi:hypothetical protein
LPPVPRPAPPPSRAGRGARAQSLAKCRSLDQAAAVEDALAVRACARRAHRSRGHGALATTLRSSDTTTAIVVASAGVLPETQCPCGF